MLPHGMGIEAGAITGNSVAGATTRAATRAATPAATAIAAEQATQQATGVATTKQATIESTHEQENKDLNDSVPLPKGEVGEGIGTQLDQQATDNSVDLKGNVPDNTPLEDKTDTRQIKEENNTVKEAAPLRRSKRIRAQVGNEVKPESDQLEPAAAPKPTTRGRKRVKVEDNALGEGQIEKPKRVPRKTKDNPYGLTPGRSPFPEWEAPSAEQCEVVYRILADMHDDVQPQSPEVIPAPSMEVTGCGEVPFVLEALIRTLLSGAVTFAGAAKMLKGIIAKFGTLKDGVAEGSIDWNKVRLSPIEDLIDAIREGGLANIKAKSIKTTLDMVYQENLDRRTAYLAERETGVPANVYGAAQKTQSQKDLEILKADQSILSLDHMRGLSADEAMREFTKYPGIGVKTAACVILFCLQIPCFAVDTHVHRFSKWLGWAPPKADENDVFSHLEVRCPDHLKYGLHQLFIRHGQTCGRCKTSTAEGTKDWDAVVCPLERLLVRSKKMSKVQKGSKKAAKNEDPENDDMENEDVKNEEDEKEGMEVNNHEYDKSEKSDLEKNEPNNNSPNFDGLEANINDPKHNELELELPRVDETVLKLKNQAVEA